MPFITIAERAVNASTLLSSTMHQTAVVTHTVFAPDPLPTSSSGVPAAVGSSSGTKVPIAAIVGGVVAGAFLAVFATLGWLFWGKAIKKTKANQRREAEDLRRTRRNTMHNAGMSRPQKNHAYRPLFGRPQEKKVKFVSIDDINEKQNGNGTAPPSGGGISVPSRVARVIAHISPKSSRNFTEVPSSPQSPSDEKQPNGSNVSNVIMPLKKLSHSQRTSLAAESGSMYSTASGEDHQLRVRPSLIMAALGSLGSTVDAAFGRSTPVGDNGSRQPGTLSTGWFGKNNQQPNPDHRLSQVSYDSALQQVIEDAPGVPIGTAL